MKRYRARKAKPGQLLAYYGKMQGDCPDVLFAWGGEGATKRHGSLLHYIFGCGRIDLIYGEEAAKRGANWKMGKTALEMLEEAGCDLTTIKFSIEMKKPTAEPVKQENG